MCVKCKENTGNIVIRHVVYCKLGPFFAFERATTADGPSVQVVFRPFREAQIQKRARTIHQHFRTEESRAQTLGEFDDRVLRWIRLDGTP